jgi:predicted unusual protein kinase regulating ubiquinone biosynthesis (AarF/ABC1/UbiB family)
MSYASKAQRNGFLLAVVHIVNRDWNELVRLYQRLGFIPVGTDLKPIEQGLEDALPDVLNADVSELNFKNVIGKLGDIMYTYVSRDDNCMKRLGFIGGFLICGSVFSFCFSDIHFRCRHFT